MTEREDALRVVGWLNEHFEAIGDVIAAHGGEILKFVGDGLLAVFPAAADQTPCADCEKALHAAVEAQPPIGNSMQAASFEASQASKRTQYCTSEKSFTATWEQAAVLTSPSSDER